MTHHSEFSDDSLNLPVAKPDLDLVVFDWDGTIVDSTGAIADSIRAAARDLGLELAAALQPHAASEPRERGVEERKVRLRADVHPKLLRAHGRVGR